MKKEIYSVTCPKRFQFGDPMYFEEFKWKKLASLVADCKPPRNFVAKVVLTEEPIEEYPDEMSRTMTLYMAPKETIDTYVDGCMYKGQDVMEKEIGVDTAKYLINVDGRYEEIHTGADGYWGNYLELSREQGKNRILDAMTVSVCMPEFEDFESMKRMTGYFFLDAQLLEAPDIQTTQMKME